MHSTSILLVVPLMEELFPSHTLKIQLESTLKHENWWGPHGFDPWLELIPTTHCGRRTLFFFFPVFLFTLSITTSLLRRKWMKLKQVFGQGSDDWWSWCQKQDKRPLEALFSDTSWGSEACPSLDSNMDKLFDVHSGAISSAHILHQARSHNGAFHRATFSDPSSITPRPCWSHNPLCCAILRPCLCATSKKVHRQSLWDNSSAEDWCRTFSVSSQHGCVSNCGGQKGWCCKGAWPNWWPQSSVTNHHLVAASSVHDHWNVWCIHNCGAARALLWPNASFFEKLRSCSIHKHCGGWKFSWQHCHSCCGDYHIKVWWKVAWWQHQQGTSWLLLLGFSSVKCC